MDDLPLWQQRFLLHQAFLTPGATVENQIMAGNRKELKVWKELWENRFFALDRNLRAAWDYRAIGDTMSKDRELAKFAAGLLKKDLNVATRAFQAFEDGIATGGIIMNNEDRLLVQTMVSALEEVNGDLHGRTLMMNAALREHGQKSKEAAIKGIGTNFPY